MILKLNARADDCATTAAAAVRIRVAGGVLCGAVLFCALNLLAVLAIITMPSGCSHSPDFVLFLL